MALIITIISILSKEFLAQFAFWCARRSGSDTLKADGWHHRTDAISSVLILIGIIAGKNIWWMDGCLGILVALIIAWTALKIILKTISSVLGEKPDINLIEEVSDICKKLAGNESNAHKFQLHDYVTHQEMTFHLKLCKKMDIEQAHDLVTIIETRIMEEKGINATIHIEPLNSC